MIKVLMMAVLLGAAGAATAAPSHHPAYGLSGQVVPPAKDSITQTTRLLRRQAHSAPPKHSELSADMYVDSQKRIADTFKQAIPDKLQADTTDVKQ